MKQSTLYFTLFLISLKLVHLAFVAGQDILDCPTCTDNHGNYTSTSPYSKNLKTLLNIISSSTHFDSGFYNVSVGHGSDIVYGNAICRADVSVADCNSCLRDAAMLLPLQCPTQKVAIGYKLDPSCMLRYSDMPIIPIKDNNLNCTLMNPRHVPETIAESFNQTLADLFDRLMKNASTSHDKRFAIGSSQVTGSSIKLYAITQCNPYLSSIDCSSCLKQGIQQLQVGIYGGRIFGPMCGIEFEDFSYLVNSSNILQPPPGPAQVTGQTRPKSGSAKNRVYGKWIAIVLPFGLLMLLAILVLSISRTYKRKKREQNTSNDQIIKFRDFQQYDFSTLRVATENFSNIIRDGKGNATTVYKGMLPDGKEIAVKQVYIGGRNNEVAFTNEVMLSANLQHKNLVKLLGFGMEKDLGLLTYEFLPNGSLHEFLHDPMKRGCLDWELRHEIILGLARGLCYLHEDSQLGVIHGDLKPSKVVLDVNMNPKISNFRKASLIHNTDQTRGATSTVIGTYGYMPPEYALRGHSSVKSDVFSFGILLLEIISGQLVSSFSHEDKQQTLLTFAWRKFNDGKGSDVVDQTLQDKQEHSSRILRFIKVGLLCVEEDPTHRPTMSAVVLMLSSDALDIAEPWSPARLILNDMDLQPNCYSSQTDKIKEETENEFYVSYLDGG